MSIIQASVGRGGVNHAEDTRQIQTLLNRHPDLPGVPLLVDGVIGPVTIAAIEAFQGRHVGMALPDGRVDPGGRTLSLLSAAPVAGGQEDWTDDSAQWPEEKKLLSLHPSMRRAVELMLEKLRARGFRPKIFYAWRSLGLQQALYETGRSQVAFSFHNATRPDGHPEALAVDIIDSRYGWEDRPETAAFWQALGEEAAILGLYWGGSWESFRDYAHVQFYDNDRLAEIRRLHGL